MKTAPSGNNSPEGVVCYEEENARAHHFLYGGADRGAGCRAHRLPHGCRPPPDGDGCQLPPRLWRGAQCRAGARHRSAKEPLRDDTGHGVHGLHGYLQPRADGGDGARCAAGAVARARAHCAQHRPCRRLCAHALAQRRGGQSVHGGGARAAARPFRVRCAAERPARCARRVARRWRGHDGGTRAQHTVAGESRHGGTAARYARGGACGAGRFV